MEEKKELLVYATRNESVAEEIKSIAGNHGNITVMRLSSKLLEDLEKNDSKENKERITLEEFLSNEDNKKNAEEKALTLWGIVTNNADLSLSKERVFTKTEVVKKTTLSHKQLNELIELLSLFGFVEVLEKSKFRFEFDDDLRRASALADIVIELRQLSVQSERYKLLHDKDNQDNAMNHLRNVVNEILFKDNRGE